MRIIVTGASGQIGGALLEALGSTWSLVPLSRRELDLTRHDQIKLVFDRIRPDLIINAAAYTAVDRAEDERKLAFQINAEAPAVIAEWAAARRVPVIHFSTDYVFDGAGSRPWRENDPANPLSAYGASKLAGDEAVRAAGGPHLIVRTSWIYAAQGMNFLRTILRLAKKQKELRIVADQVGAPTSARLVANAISKIIDSGQMPLDRRLALASGIVNLAASGETTWHGFAISIVDGLKQRGIALTVERISAIATGEYQTKARRPANSRLDLGRLTQVFGICPPQWEQALAVELDHLARNGELCL